MGIYDREYYRDETRGSGWLSGVAPACKALILINVGIFVAEVVFQHAALSETFGAYSDQIFRRGRVWQLLTAAFLHDSANPFHIIWNMLFLWMAGREVESMYGSREFVAFYLTAAVFSTLCWAVLDALGVGRSGGVMLGASGAVTAVVMLYTLYNPRREVLFFFVLPIEMWLLMVIFLGCDFVALLQQLHGAPAAGVAFASHLGGAAYGYLYKSFDLRWSHLVSFRLGRRRPKLRVVKPDLYDREMDVPLPAGSTKSVTTSPASRPSPNVAHAEEQLEARLDEVLAKIAREGKGGLTEEENRVLQEASRRAQDRRSDRVR
jgi:membrane associated rhomboid family serine protease